MSNGEFWHLWFIMFKSPLYFMYENLKILFSFSILCNEKEREGSYSHFKSLLKVKLQLFTAILQPGNVRPIQGDWVSLETIFLKTTKPV